MPDLTPDLAELRRLAEAAEPFVRPGGTDPATVTLLASDVLALLDRLAHMTEARDNARAEVERLTAIVNSDVLEATRGGVRIPRFDVPYPGGSTTADFMRTMAERLPSKRVMGSNCSNTASSILAAYADALDALDGRADS